jgi:hypothetical protein
MNKYSGPPMTRGNTAAAHLRLMGWCLDCQRQVEPVPAETAKGLDRRDKGAGLTGATWVRRLACRHCGQRHRAARQVKSAPVAGA